MNVAGGNEVGLTIKKFLLASQSLGKPVAAAAGDSLPLQGMTNTEWERQHKRAEVAAWNYVGSVGVIKHKALYYESLKTQCS